MRKGVIRTALHNHFFWDSPKILFMHIQQIVERYGVPFFQPVVN
jgi:Domain of Unknown Function (DUF1259)